MLKIRLARTGKKKQPSYRVVVANKDARRDGRVVERIGHYNPLVNPAEYRIQEDRALYWLSVGAQPTDAVRRLLEKQGTIARLQRFHAGEPMDALVAEYTGVAATAVAAAEPVVAEEVAEEIAEEVETAVVEVVEFEDAVEEEVAEETDQEEAAEEEVVVEEVAEEAADDETTETESE
ncbi:MAG TPA: 30S ribosomal protein S16 [Chloroflexota bacterium]|nr:30S ribosomal protein S16 [Chloroflexota bacterium]HUM68079.1 30S ribosomal protein S16 [Chloroflexota bacterium]